MESIAIQSPKPIGASAPWLSGVSAASLAALEQSSQPICYARGESIFTPATPPETPLLVWTGKIRMYQLSSKGVEATLGIALPGELIGECMLFGQPVEECFADAVSATGVWAIPAPALRALIERCGGAGLGLLRQSSARLQAARRRIAALALCDTRSRIAQALLTLGEDHGTSNGRQIRIDVTQHELAALVGATRQTVNAVLRGFDREGWMQLRRCHVLLLAPERLRETAAVSGAA